MSDTKIENGWYLVRDGVTYKVNLPINVPFSKRINLMTGEVYYPSNADRIRQMSDEELARFLARQAGRYCDYKDPEDEEYERVLPWLKSPVEEGE